MMCRPPCTRINRLYKKKYKEEIDYIKVAFLISLVVRISRSHREDRGSIPLWGNVFLFLSHN